MDILRNYPRRYPLVEAMTVILFAGFIYNGFHKYDPTAGNYVPHIENSYKAAGLWLDANTPADAVILAAPLQPGWNCRLMETRAVHLGFIPHVAHLGIDWQDRAQKIFNYFRKAPVYMADIDYVVYGQDERKLFPDFALQEEPVYFDNSVRIWKMTE